MSNPVTILAPIKLAPGVTEADLLAASHTFQQEFVNQEACILRRELIKKSETEYMDIVQFIDEKSVYDVMEKEQSHPACQAFFALMSFSEEELASPMPIYPSLSSN
jgi:glutaredoxin 2